MCGMSFHSKAHYYLCSGRRGACLQINWSIYHSSSSRWLALDRTTLEFLARQISRKTFLSLAEKKKMRSFINFRINQKRQCFEHFFHNFSRESHSSYCFQVVSVWRDDTCLQGIFRVLCVKSENKKDTFRQYVIFLGKSAPT